MQLANRAAFNEQRLVQRKHFVLDVELTDLLGCFDAVHDWHVEVQHYKVEQVILTQAILNDFESFETVMGFCDRERTFLKEHA